MADFIARRVPWPSPQEQGLGTSNHEARRVPWPLEIAQGLTASQVAGSGGGGGLTYINRALDPDGGGLGVSQLVVWLTPDAPDTSGQSYPGPSAFAATSDYCVQSVYGRSAPE